MVFPSVLRLTDLELLSPEKDGERVL
jgi:hypothetical protein